MAESTHDELAALVAAQALKIQELEATITQLRAEVTELKRRLGQNFPGNPHCRRRRIRWNGRPPRTGVTSTYTALTRRYAPRGCRVQPTPAAGFSAGGVSTAGGVQASRSARITMAAHGVRPGVHLGGRSLTPGGELSSSWAVYRWAPESERLKASS